MKQRSKEKIPKLKQRRLSAITLQGAIEKYTLAQTFAILLVGKAITIARQVEKRQRNKNGSKED